MEKKRKMVEMKSNEALKQTATQAVAGKKCQKWQNDISPMERWRQNPMEAKMKKVAWNGFLKKANGEGEA